MNSRDIRHQFLDFFSARGHQVVESSPLIPKEDPSLLFTNAGMVQFKRMFLGEERRDYTRAATSQKCMRAGGKHNDLENVGYTARHHTFFEMLGNFSFGDYFKEEAIAWAWELLTVGYRLPTEKLHVSVFQDDDEAHTIWEREIGVPSERIYRLGEKDNFWAMGETGPCGPCSEIHMDQGPALGCGRPECEPGCDCDRYLEIWNLVFTQFDRDQDGHLSPLPNPNIDTGMGLERLAAVVQGVGSNYETDLFRGLIGKIEQLSEKPYGEDSRQDVAFRVIADHARAVAFLVGDGVLPSNEGRGYVLRRIIRRAIRFGQTLGLATPFLQSICSQVIDTMGEDYGELLRSRSFIEGLVKNEENRFADTLHYGMQILNEEIQKLKAANQKTIPGEVAFKLYDTYGLSVDIVADVARDENLDLDISGYQEAMSRRRSLSQKSWQGSGEEEIPEVFRNFLARGITTRFRGYDALRGEATVVAVVSEGREAPSVSAGSRGEILLDQTVFYGQAGGQVGDTGWLETKEGGEFRVTDTVRYGHDLIVHQGYMETGNLAVGERIDARVDQERRKATARNHSATHLLHTALREVLGDHVKQAGSLVSPERLRFDFSHFKQVEPDRLVEIEDMVNYHIRENLPVETTEMSRQEAMKTGAIAIFEERYGDQVRLVNTGEGLSMELCGGTHTEHTGDIGLFRILGEGAVGANVRRIEALTGQSALEHDREQDLRLKKIAALLRTAPEQAAERVEQLLHDSKEKEREREALKAKLRSKQSEDYISMARDISGIRVLALEVEAESPKELRDTADKIRDKLRSGVILLGARGNGRVMLACVVTKDLLDRFKAGEIIQRVSPIVGGKGGGRPDMAQGGGSRPDALGEALDALYQFVAEQQ